MKTNPKSNAFPVETQTDESFNGLTKREYFAAMALQGILANEQAFNKVTINNAAEGNMSIAGYLSLQAVALADALIAELNK